jgi:hypothetical protein
MCVYVCIYKSTHTFAYASMDQKRTYRVPKLVSYFGLDSVLLTESCLLDPCYGI